MIKKTFFGISLKDKQKFTFKEQNGLLCYTFTQIVLDGKGEAKVYGLTDNKKILIASLKAKQNQCKCKFIMDENNFRNLICIGDESTYVHVIGYKLENKNQEIQEICQEEDLAFKDEFRALQPLEERELDSDEVLLLSKQEQKEYKKKQKQKQLNQKY
ncbi:unnamed protein product [Paramecium sonneborni]|uniref:Uncharacterized protein n=1 Tax=Paramecium sonneborni TaxID=65129 RepID=A0A8S1N521_9CILI|nr:unnamed protein product [Paramecium sonneborni]